MELTAKNEDRAVYQATPTKTIEAENAIIARALEILESRMRKPIEVLPDPDAVKAFLRLRIGGLPHETFTVLFLDAQNRVIEIEEMFRGTLTQTSVYPREVVLSALRSNAASVILAHNHPSGNVRPSRADELLTSTLKQSLALVDVRVLDHIVVSADASYSMAETGLI